jgi:hypothetical protein
MPLSDRQIEAGSRIAVVLSGEEVGRPAVTTTEIAGGKLALDVTILGGAGAGGTSMLDDAAFTPGTTGITPAGGYYNSAGEAVDDGDAGAFAMSQRRAIHATLRTPNDDSAMDEANDSVNVTIVAGGGTGGTAQTDDAAFTPGVDDVTPAGFFFDDVAPDSVDEGDIGAGRMSANRNQYTTIRDAAGNERGANVDAANNLQVLVNNAGAGAAVNIQDGANSITVDDGGGALSVDDAGGSLTVDDGGVPLSVDDNGGSLTVDNAALSVVGGGGEATAQRVTIANDSTGVLSVDDNGGSLTIDNATLSVTGGGVEATALRVTIANDSTGQVDVTDRIGRLAGRMTNYDVLNNGTIAALNATVSLTAAGLGTVGLGVTGTWVGTLVAEIDVGDGVWDLIPMVDNTLGSAVVSTTVNGNWLLGVAGALTLRIRASAWTSGTATIFLNGTSAAAGVFLSRSIPTGVNVIGSVVLAAGANSIGTLGANSGVDIGDVDVTSVPAPLNVVGGGVEATALRVTIANDSTGLVSVDDNGGSLTVDAAGDIADDAIDSGNPVKVGGVAVETDDTDPGEVAEGDRANFRTDMNRRQLVNLRHPRGFSTNDEYAAAQTDQQIQAAPGANLSLYITDVTMSVNAACNIELVRNTAASTTIFGAFYFAAKGGLVQQFLTPIRLPANENLGVTSSAAVNHTVSVQGYIAP